MKIQSMYIISDEVEALEGMIFAGKQVAEKVTAVVFGEEAVVEQAKKYGADKLISCPIAEYCAEDYSRILADMVKKEEIAAVLVCSTIRGKVIAGKMGVYLDCTVTAGVSEWEVVDGTLVTKKMVYGGAAIQTEKLTASYCVMTATNGTFADPEALPATTEVETVSETPKSTIKCIETKEITQVGTNLAVAKRIVDVGRGLAEEADLAMCRELASVLGAEVGCSRPVAENNKWLPKSFYIGVTGVQVKPDLCLLLGVSGQVQHLVGIAKSKVVVAINKDKNAPIFNYCDFGIVGDIYKVVPELMKQLS